MTITDFDSTTNALARAEVLQTQANTIETLALVVGALQRDEVISLSQIIEAVTKGDLSLLIRE